MRIFHCDSCRSPVFFENTRCLKCGGALGFVPERLDLCTLQEAQPGQWTIFEDGVNSGSYRRCENGVRHGACNWMVPAQENQPFCEACRLNETIPDLGVGGNLERWQRLEAAKRRVLYSLRHLGLSIEVKGRCRLRFRFLAQVPGGEPVTTGHDHGVITINVAEADDVARETLRVTFKERYRTVLGHMRHEIAHFFWELFIAGTERVQPFRALFGDESADYGAALRRYYETGPPAHWNQRFVSAYAGAHPWEDWAESFAHYLHIADMVETASNFGLSLRPDHPDAEVMTTDLTGVDDTTRDFERMIDAWLPLTFALNELNRGMGLPDAYPFVLSKPVLAKLGFVHRVVRETKGNPGASP